jgi:hypothetical protein
MVIDNSAIMQNIGGFGGASGLDGTSAGDVGNGGGIFNSGTLVVNRSAISFNTAGWAGNGISSDGSFPPGNGGVGGSGGGVYNQGLLV